MLRESVSSKAGCETRAWLEQELQNLQPHPGETPSRTSGKDTAALDTRRKFEGNDTRCESSSGQIMVKTRGNTSMAADESQKQKKVIDEARTKGAKVHFASLMDICHLKNAELEAKHQKYKGRVVLRGDIVKDDSGACAVFTEQGSSASQITAAKVMDVISRLPGCAGQAADAVSAYTQVKMDDAPTLLKNPKSECPDIWIRLPRHKWPKSWSSIEDPVVPLERNLHGHPLAGYNGIGNSRKFYGNTVGKKFQIGNAFWKRRKRTILVCACGRYKTG